VRVRGRSIWLPKQEEFHGGAVGISEERPTITIQPVFSVLYIFPLFPQLTIFNPWITRAAIHSQRFVDNPLSGSALPFIQSDVETCRLDSPHWKK
jgi:hypothetical protein